MLRLSRDFFREEVQADRARWAMMTHCFLSGFIGCVSFSACSVWIGFQTGNTAQVGMAISRSIYSHSHHYHGFFKNDLQALASVTAFATGAQIDGRLLPMRRNSRGRLMLSTILQILLCTVAAITVHLCHEPAFTMDRRRPSWHDGYGFATLVALSACFGMQGAASEGLETAFGATVVLTSTWCQLAVMPWPWRRNKPRDDKVLAIILFIIGAILARFILVAAGSAVTIAIGTGLRVAVLFVWAICRPTARRAEQKDQKSDGESANHALAISRSNDSMATLAIRS